ncbi:hypothetical protein HDA32_004450 [Spinactinospora alkalitolerans]|uniref:Uncharacterized protein n=1 Tax=Spinactinospora alkalitolerans TaxID=687207 RepID=A0A852U5Y8_9ACTN|nr:hypothetical protein [Spinactinospora alkalitolerans]NYE49330.1 hypothetical protein [Spinactinospora alkalitolerans]
MHYAVQIEVEIPGDAGELDELRSRGGAQILLEQLDAVVRIQGPDGAVVRLHAVRCLAHGRGAVVSAVAEAPSPEDAETGLRLTVARLLLEHEALDDWQVTGCRVQGPDGDLPRRAADPGTVPPAAPRAGSAGSEIDRARVRRCLLVHAPRLRAFGPEMFGLHDGAAPAPRCADLLAGSLLMGVYAFFDGLYRDLDALHRIGGGTAADLAEPQILGVLPEPVAHRCDIGFVRRFLLVAGTGAHRLVESCWRPPACLGEALAVRTMFRAAHDHLSGHALLADAAGYFEALAENAFAPAHLESLRLLDERADPLGGPHDPYAMSTWFTPADDLEPVHPYAYGPASV